MDRGMNAVAQIAEPRAVPFRATTFAAFKVNESGRTYALGQVDAPSVKDAVNASVGKFALHHKEHLLLRETGPAGVKIHLFAIKRRSNPRYVWQGHEQKRVHDLYADPVCSFDGGVVG